jgi:hypothetical protein
MGDNAAVWVVDDAHRHEAGLSQKRDRELMPDVTLITLSPQGSYRLVCEVYQGSAWNAELNHKRFIFFDSDTYLIEPINDVYEVFAALSHRRHARARALDMPALPDTGCVSRTEYRRVGYANDLLTRDLFSHWFVIMVEHIDAFGITIGARCAWRCGSARFTDLDYAAEYTVLVSAASLFACKSAAWARHLILSWQRRW